jgi:predicted nucleotidyltransferase
MRLSKKEIKILKTILYKLNSDAKLYLFGSRVDDSKRGGDIDLLIVSDNFTKKLLRRFRVEFFKCFGEQKLDVIVDDGSFLNPFHKMVYQKAVEL